MLVASRQMSTEDFAAFRKEAKAAEDDLKFLKEEADAFYRDANAQRQDMSETTKWVYEVVQNQEETEDQDDIEETEDADE